MKLKDLLPLTGKEPVTIIGKNFQIDYYIKNITKDNETYNQIFSIALEKTVKEINGNDDGGLYIYIED